MNVKTMGLSLSLGGTLLFGGYAAAQTATYRIPEKQHELYNAYQKTYLLKEFIRTYLYMRDSALCFDPLTDKTAMTEVLQSGPAKISFLASAADSSLYLVYENMKGSYCTTDPQGYKTVEYVGNNRSLDVLGKKVLQIGLQALNNAPACHCEYQARYAIADDNYNYSVTMTEFLGDQNIVVKTFNLNRSTMQIRPNGAYPDASLANGPALTRLSANEWNTAQTMQYQDVVKYWNRKNSNSP